MRRIIALTLCVALLLAACGSDNAEKAEDLPEAGPLLQESADKIQNADTIEVEIDVSGYPVAIQPDGLALPDELPLFFKYARGMFQAPDRLSATIQFSLGVLSTTASLIALDRDHYFRGDLTANRWINAELIPGFSPASLMARPGGVAYALLNITDLEMVGKEDLDGLDVFHLRGTIQAEAVYALTFGLIRSREGDLQIEVFIDQANEEVVLIKLVEPPPTDADEPDTTTWTINFIEYNQETTITAPSMDN